MAGVTMHMSDDAMADIIRQGDVSKLEAWIRDGLDLARWRDSSGYNIYHLCVTNDNSYGALCVAEAVPRICHTHNSLLTQVNYGYRNTCSPLTQACHFSVFDEAYILAVVEFLIRHSEDIHYEELLLKSRRNPRMYTYLAWRQRNPSGLPKEIARLPNHYILRFIETVEGMDTSTARQYMMSIQEQAEESRNIRIIILGYQGVGKTTLLLRLTGQGLSTLRSTDQVDIHQNMVIVDMETRKCWLLPKAMEHDVTRSRLHDVIINSVSSHKGSTITRDDLTGVRSLKRKSEATVNVKEEPNIALYSEAGTAMIASNITLLGSAKSRAYVHMFDFGGEIMFSNFQHIFLNTNSVILLCFSLHNVFTEKNKLDDPREELTFTTHSHIRHLMQMPTALTDYQTFLYFAETDMNMGIGYYIQGEKTSIKDRVKTQLLKKPKHATAYHRHVLAFEVVDNGSNTPDKAQTAKLDRRNPIINYPQYDVLWERICAAAIYQSQWKQLLPAKWILLERDLLVLKSQGKKVMTLEEIKLRAKHLSVPLEDDDVIAMLRYLHGTRSILCFQLDHPDDKVILDIKFVIDAFRLIVTDITFHQRKTNIDPSIQQGYGKPRLTMDFIHAIWKHGSEFHFFSETLLFYLERLELLVKPLPEDGETSVDYFIVPCLLDEADPSGIREMLIELETVKCATLCFDFQERFIPPAVYNKILASCIHRFALFAKADSDNEMYLQQGLACFVLSPRWKMILHCKDSRLKITLFSTTISEIMAGDGYNIRCIMEAIIDATLERHQQGRLKYKYFISSDFEVTGNEVMVPVELPTEASSLMDAEVSVWCREQKQVQHENDFPMDILDKCLTVKEMSHVAKFIGTDYCLLFVELGLSTAAIEQTRWSIRACLRTLVTYLLVTWSNKLGEKAVVGLLLKGMESLGFNGADIIEHLQEMTQAGTHQSTSDDDGRCPTERERMIIAKKINPSYVIFFLELDLDIETIDRARMDHLAAIERFFVLMTKWVQLFGLSATLTKVYEAAKECSMNWTKLRMEIQKCSEDASGS